MLKEFDCKYLLDKDNSSYKNSTKIGVALSVVSVSCKLLNANDNSNLLYLINLKTKTMKGFIKVSDLNNQDYYLNIIYIVQFITLNEEYDGETMVYVTGGANVSRIQTNSTVKEIVDMIDLATK
jgi:hypothetical protein